MSDHDLLWERRASEDANRDEPRDATPPVDRHEILNELAEATEAVERLSQDLAAWYEHQSALQDRLHILIQHLESPDAENRISSDQVGQSITNLIRTLDERLGRVDFEQRFAQVEHRLDQLRRDIQASQSDLMYVKEKIQVSYGILITVPVLTLLAILLWLWWS